MSLYSIGLVSATLRQLPPSEVIDIATQANLRKIEWSADRHVPHGELDVASKVQKQSSEAGMEIICYGSYYRIGSSEEEKLSFETILTTAQVLKAPTIRVWAGIQASAFTSTSHRKWMVDETKRICQKAGEAATNVALEYIRDTMTDSLEACLSFIDEVNEPNLLTLWQPQEKVNAEDCMDELDCLVDCLAHIHVNTRDLSNGERINVEEADAFWPPILHAFAENRKPTNLLIEFVKTNSKEQLMDDAVTLQRWIDEVEISL
ncbi:MAG: TIM barrel protein [Verrucomicrobiota bacterium]